MTARHFVLVSVSFVRFLATLGKAWSFCFVENLLFLKGVTIGNVSECQRQFKRTIATRDI